LWIICCVYYELQEQMKNTVLCDWALCSQIDCCQHFVRTCFLHLWGWGWNIGISLPDCMASHPRKQ
jgi:hypothetical protein